MDQQQQDQQDCICAAKTTSSKCDLQPEMFKDLPELIALVLKPLGRYQIALLLALNFNSAIIGISHTLTSFHTFTPPFHCPDYANTTGCPDGETDNQHGQCPSGFKFDTSSDHTLVSEWSLVCNRRLLAPLVNSLYFVGVTFGALIFGIMTDKYGRRRMILLCIHMQGLFGLLQRTANAFEWFVVFRTVQGFFVQGLQTCTYTLLLEYCPPKIRTLAGVTWELNWAIGLGILGGTSYVIREWRKLQLILTVPTVIALLYIWQTPESIYWLYATGRKKQAFKLAIRTARLNGHSKDIEEYQRINMINLNTSDISSVPSQTQIRTRTTYHQIIRTQCLRKHILIMTMIWYSVSLSYYGILYFLPNLAGNRHGNFIVGAAIEVIAYGLAFVILSKYGRQIPMATYQIINGIICIVIGLLIVALPNHQFGRDTLVAILSLIAKGLAVSSFCGMFIYTSELFPTVCRGASIGICGFWARIGSLSAPFLMILAEYVSPILPMSIIGASLLITGIITLMLPETLNRHLPNTIDEAQDMWKTK